LHETVGIIVVDPSGVVMLITGASVVIGRGFFLQNAKKQVNQSETNNKDGETDPFALHEIGERISVACLVFQNTVRWRCRIWIFSVRRLSSNTR
jgi:hypothetical protein